MGGCEIREDNVGSLLGAGDREQPICSWEGRWPAPHLPPMGFMRSSLCPAEFWWTLFLISGFDVI